MQITQAQGPHTLMFTTLLLKLMQRLRWISFIWSGSSKGSFSDNQSTFFYILGGTNYWLSFFIEFDLNTIHEVHYHVISKNIFMIDWLFQEHQYWVIVSCFLWQDQPGEKILLLIFSSELIACCELKEED